MSKSTPREDLVAGIWRNNPVFAQFLGLCPTLAVTNTLANGIAMALATSFVLIGSSFLVSSLKRFIPSEVRITAYIVIIATFVTIVDLVMAALVPAIYKTMAAFIALIVVNCIILGRQEAFAAKNTVGRSLLDALGNSTGFTMALILMSGVRELLGSGTLLGVDVMGPSFEPWVIMVLPPGGFFTLAFYLLIFGWWKDRAQKRAGKIPLRAWPHQVTRVSDPDGEEVLV
ncbi:MAG TPA: electron transport complex subunit E [Longimicrobiales bacterium]|nr:electron transport complex subunit E [Longimicrobiales bacterium]